MCDCVVRLFCDCAGKEQIFECDSRPRRALQKKYLPMCAKNIYDGYKGHSVMTQAKRHYFLFFG
jgi:hypothetical protein